MASVTVFISHKQEDATPAFRVKARLEANRNVAAYLDVFDQHLTRSAEDLTEHLRRQLDNCTHLMAVVSVRTQESWWVPFEIGLATEKAYPISTFAVDSSALPEYLRKWPYLKSEADIDLYVRVALQTQSEILNKGLRTAVRRDRATYATDFHSSLKRALGQ